MRYIKYNLEIGYCGCDDEGVTTIPDNYDDGDIDMMVNDMANEHAASWEGDERLGFSYDADYDSEEYQEEVDSFYANVSGSWDFITEEKAKEEGWL